MTPTQPDKGAAKPCTLLFCCYGYKPAGHKLPADHSTVSEGELDELLIELRLLIPEEKKKELIQAYTRQQILAVLDKVEQAGPQDVANSDIKDEPLISLSAQYTAAAIINETNALWHTAINNVRKELE